MVAESFQKCRVRTINVRSRRAPLPRKPYLFRSCGIFPEQIDNWSFIYNAVRRAGLLLHGYQRLCLHRGRFLLQGRQAEVTHLDAVKQVVTGQKRTWNWQFDEYGGLLTMPKVLKREYKRGKHIMG